MGAVPGREQSRWEEGGRDMGGCPGGPGGPGCPGGPGGPTGRDMRGAGDGEVGGSGLRAITGVAENVSEGNHT